MRNRIIVYFLLLFIGASFIGGSVFTTYNEFVSEGILQQRKEVVIPKGAGLKQVAYLLQKEGVIESPSIFLIGVRASGNAGQIKAGEYSFPARSSPKMVMTILVSGETYIRRIVIPEGLTSAQIVELLDKSKGLKGSVSSVPRNGTLLPDTYHYSWGDSKEGILLRMQRAMDRTLESLWESRDKSVPLRDVKEAVILASVVEKEAALQKEMPLIASAFINRLNKGMKLQSDPTALYAVTEGKYDLKRSLTYQDLRFKSPYNTYVVQGLPRGAIANPGRKALEAVLNPAKTNYIYFVADGTGGHSFAATYQEHQKNVSVWRSIQKRSRKKQKENNVSEVTPPVKINTLQSPNETE
jgi:UPF0755 protein